MENGDHGRLECHVFSPRTGEWARIINLNVSKCGGDALTINTSTFEVARIEQICNGQIVVLDE